MILKISVLSSGVVLLDSRPIEPKLLEEALKDAKSKNGVVRYYREASSTSLPQAATVLELVVKNKLPISFASKPDFSDWVYPKGISHPKANALDKVQGSTEAPEPQVPEVIDRANNEDIFANVRRAAARAKGPCGLVMVRPDRRYLILPVLSATPSPTARAADIERLIPSAVKRNVAVIGDTSFTTEKPGRPSMLPTIADANRFIPFFGMLMSLSYMGHAVWVFEGHSSALAAGCRDADVLIVDSGMLPFLRQGWEDAASSAMRNANILIHDRKTYRLLVARKVGHKSDQLEFPN